MQLGLAVDLGNRFVKVAGGAVPTDFWLYESVYAFGAGPGSLYYVNGSRQDWVGKTWVVGAAARHYRRPIPTWSGEKADAALPLVLGAVGTLAGLEKVELDLAMSLPYGESNVLEQQLVGTHELVCAGGRKLKVVIGSVRVEPEGLGIYRYGAAQVQGGLTGVLDLGGGTAIALLVDEHGKQIESARVVLRRGGVYGLAADIASDPRLQAQVVGTPKIELIMNGIADNSCRYGAQGATFARFFEERLELWMKGILGELLNRWDPWLDEVGVVLVAGGGAPLAARVLGENSWFRVLDNPQFAQVLGLRGVLG